MLRLQAAPGWRNPRVISPSPETAGADAASNPCEGGRYHRLDLAFAADGSRFTAQTDGSDGATEAAVQLALSRLLLARDGLLVHASAGVDPAGGAWLVPGPSGAGKSTVARGAGFARVLADEMLVVRRATDGAGFTVWPTPFWSLGRRPPLQQRPAPLAVLARPIQATAPAAAPLDRAAAAAWLMGCVAWYDDAPDARAHAFAVACDIASAAPRCVALEFPLEGPWLTAVQSPG